MKARFSIFRHRLLRPISDIAMECSNLRVSKSAIAQRLQTRNSDTRNSAILDQNALYGNRKPIWGQSKKNKNGKPNYLTEL